MTGHPAGGDVRAPGVATDAEPVDVAAPAGRPRRWVAGLLLTVITLGLLAAGGGLAVALGVGRTDTPTVDSVDAGFARDMSRHHLQAVEMANLALSQSSDAEVRRLAFDISSTQTNQVGRMQGWLTLWGLPLTSTEVMAWMTDGSMAGHDMSHPSGTAGQDGAVMPGMATETELTELRSLSGTPFDVLFLQLMIRHHQGGLEMAEYGEQHAAEAAVRGLAGAIVASQSAETATMQTMLSARGGTPLAGP